MSESLKADEPGLCCYGLAQDECLALSVSVQNDNGLNLQSLVLAVLLYGYETWTLKSDLEWRINALSTMYPRRIMGYRRNDCVIGVINQ